MLVWLLALGVKFVAKSRRLRRAQDARTRQRARLALDTTCHISYPATFLRASDFVTLGELVMHEELRDRGLLLYLDDFERLALGKEYTVFISHQWTSFDAPDATGEQYAVMCAAVRHVVAHLVPASRAGSKAATTELSVQMGPDGAMMDEMMGRVLVWCDYCSIPQLAPDSTQLAIQSLAAYASLASAFVIVAPPVEHSDLPGTLCNFDSYR
jgi:hypothetical protein